MEKFHVKVMTADEQARMTPGMVIETLKRGNRAFVDNRFIVQNNIERVQEAAKGQFPLAVILSCIDSRVPVADVFQCGIGDIFVVRVAGNIVNPDILGSLEIACKLSGAKLVMVLGHGCCSAVKMAIDGVAMGNITGLLDRIKPAVDRSTVGYTGETASSNPDFVERVCHANIKRMVNEIRKDSPLLKTMEDNGQIKVIGAYYNIYNGEVDFFENL